MSTEEMTDIPDGFREMMDENDWSDEAIEAWRVLHEARPGDMVLWADRSVPMEVVEREQGEEGHHVLYVEKPRGEGTYEVHEKYNSGRPKFTSPIGRATDLHWVERQPEPRGVTEEQYESLVDTLVGSAHDAFLRMDYEDWAGAVTDVVEGWSEDVALRQWRGYRHHPDWEDGDPEAIFESVVGHAMQDGGGGRDEQPEGEDSLNPREQAEITLYNRVYSDGKRRAEASIISSEADYYDLVEKLAQHTVDRFERKSYTDARTATRDTISDWIDDRGEPVYNSIIEHSEMRFEWDEYEADHVDKAERELAFDLLDHDVWEEVQIIQRERGNHDPTLRGMTYTAYQDLVGGLAERVSRIYDGRGFLRTTVKDVVTDWADEVEAEEWEGHRHRVYADGDTEDIFASVATHADTDPFVWNPFADDKERRMAVQSLVPDVLSESERIIDERQPEAMPVPADQYIDETLDLDGVSYEDLKDAEPDDAKAAVGRIMDAMDGDEVGWTFADEIIESGGRVPESTNNWILVDYGVIREDETLRRLAWFDRSTGDALVLSGMATEPPDALADTEQPYNDFHVAIHEGGGEDPDFLLTDSSLDDALSFVYDYIGADRADFRIIEGDEGTFVQDQITDEDINAGGAVDALIPNLSIGADDLTTLADTGGRSAAEKLGFWGPELAKITAYALMSVAPKFLSDRLDGVRVQPNVHQKHGVGANISKEFGDPHYESGIGGRANVEINVRPQTFKELGQKYAPKFVNYGFGEGDIAKGQVRYIGETMDKFRSYKQWRYFEDNASGEILDADLDDLSFEEVQDLADKSGWEHDPDIYYGAADRDKDQPKGTALRDALREYAEDDVQRYSWGDTLIDNFGGSIESFYDVLRRGSVRGKREDRVRESLVDEYNVSKEEIPQEVVEEYIMEADHDDFSWEDFEQQDLGISGMLMRGLDAESTVAAAKFLNVDDWLENNLTFYGSDYVMDDPPTFEEWEAERFGPGQNAGPEERARRLARFHKEVAGAEEPPEPLDELGYAGDDEMTQGDYDNAQYDFDDSFGDNYEDVAERFASDEPVSDDAEAQDGPE